MGMDLRGGVREFRFNWKGWQCMLQLAQLFGWKPAGTEPPSAELGGYEDWDGSYYSNDYQRVNDHDARSIAEALERALPDVPDHDALTGKAVVHSDGTRGVPVDTEVTPFEWFCGKGKAHLRDFIAFCREGGFLIG